MEGLRVAHATDLEGVTGCTVILCVDGAVAGVDVRGGASGTIEIGVLDPMHITPQIHGITLAGGSAFGLEASCGVRRFLAAQRVGFERLGVHVPIVPGAILYDLGIGSAWARPGREMGEAAAAAAFALTGTEQIAEGNVGAGTGATVGKLHGVSRAMKGGLGTAAMRLGGSHEGVVVAALVAVNAFGDVLEDGAVIAGVRQDADSTVIGHTKKELLSGSQLEESGMNTTIAVVATNARLSKVECTKMAQLAQAGMIRAISPVHTTRDGDVVFGLATGKHPGVSDVNLLGLAAAEVLEASILRAVKLARSLGGVPGLAA